MNDLINEDNLQEIGDYIVDIIKRRSAEGRGANGRTFKKKADGKKSVIRDTGDLLDGLEAEVSSDGTIVITTDVDYAAYVNDTRPFMGLTNNDRRELQVVIKNLLQTVEQRYKTMQRRSR